MSLLNRGQVLIKTVWYANCPAGCVLRKGSRDVQLNVQLTRAMAPTPAYSAAYECSVGLPWLQYSGVVQVVAFRRPPTAARANGREYVDLQPHWRLQVVTPLEMRTSYV